MNAKFIPTSANPKGSKTPRPTKIVYRSDDHRFDLHMNARTNDELAFRAYMVRIHGGWVDSLPSGRQVTRGVRQ